MASIDETPINGGLTADTPPGGLLRFPEIANIQDARRFYCEVLKMYSDRRLRSGELRDWIYAVSILLQLLQSERALNIEERLDRLEAFIEGER